MGCMVCGMVSVFGGDVVVLILAIVVPSGYSSVCMYDGSMGAPVIWRVFEHSGS